MDESKLRIFDAAEFLDSEEAIAAYLSAVMLVLQDISFLQHQQD